MQISELQPEPAILFLLAQSAILRHEPSGTRGQALDQLFMAVACADDNATAAAQARAVIELYETETNEGDYTS